MWRLAAAKVRKRVLPLAATALAALALAVVSCRPAVEPVLTPAAWEFGTIKAAEPVQQTVTVENPGRRTVRAVFISTCDCLIVEPDRLKIRGGERERVTLRYDPSEDEGEVRMRVIVQTRQGKSTARQMLDVFGLVLPGHPPAEGPERPGLPPAAEQPELSFEYFYDPGCRGCEIFLVRQMMHLQQELQIRLRAIRRDIREAEVLGTYTRLLEALGEEERAYPAVVFEGSVLQGEEEIQREFENVLRQHLSGIPGQRDP